MREIKFRIWTGHGMEYNVMVGFLGCFYVQGMDERDSASLSPFNINYDKNIPLMKYTGIKDNNKKQVYEGDICRFDTENGIVKAKVSWRESTEENDWISGFYFSLLDNEEGYKNDESVEFEIIGNIYENPELLSN